MSRIVLAGLSWIVAILLALTSVLDTAHAVLLAGCVTALTVIWPPAVPASPRLPELPFHSHPGGRRDLSDLSWSAFERDGRVSAKVVARVRAVAQSAIADEPQLPAIDATRSPTPAQVLDWLDLIESRQGES